MVTVEDLKQVDAAVAANNYSDETFEKMLPYYQMYLDARVKLRALSLGDKNSALVMMAGGVR